MHCSEECRDCAHREVCRHWSMGLIQYPAMGERCVHKSRYDARELRAWADLLDSVRHDILAEIAKMEGMRKCP